MSDKPAKSASFSVRAYFLTFLALAVLLVLTIIAAHLRLGGISTLLSMGIAAIKAVLVALIFMHIRLSSRSTWVFAGSGILWLAILFTFTAADYLTRNHYTGSPALSPNSALIRAELPSVSDPLIGAKSSPQAFPTPDSAIP